MSSWYSAGMEQRPYFKEVASYYDEDWNDTVDDARIFCAWWVLRLNVDTAASYLLNQDKRAENPAAWDETLEWLADHRGLSAAKFEWEADEFLKALKRKHR